MGSVHHPDTALPVPAREIVADYKSHVPGEREVVDWTRPGHHTHFNVPLMFVREVTAEDYFAQFPHMRGRLPLGIEVRFWEVSID